MESTIKIIYVAGNGHSGSTILAMLLANDPSCFCGGELTFITRPGISDEYCSCGVTIGNCKMWRRIMASWESSREIDLERYSELRLRFERNRTLPLLMLNVLRPGKDFLDYCKATQSLFESIAEVSGATTIIDSSKGAARILILKRFSKLGVIHLCRNFTGVLNSNRRFTPKNIVKGYETDLHPVSPGRTLFNWLSNNLLVSLFSVSVPKCRIHYRQLVNGQIGDLCDLGCDISTSPDESFSADHMLAGNGLRLRTIKLDATLGFRYEQLTKSQLRWAPIIDKVFWFWSK